MEDSRVVLGKTSSGESFIGRAVAGHVTPLASQHEIVERCCCSEERDNRRLTGVSYIKKKKKDFLERI